MRRLRADLAVIGAGSGGLSVAAGAAQLGLKVVLYERGEMGGDCLNTGCVPSKALIAAAHAAHAARDGFRFGVRTGPVEIDFPAAMAHVRGAVAAIAPHDSQERFEKLGCTVVREHARFAGPTTLVSASTRTDARRIVVAAGSRARPPAIPGLDGVPFLTNETVFDLVEKPERLLVVGAGPIGCELGQAFRRLGSQVVLVEAGRPLGKEDPALVAVVLEQLAADGVELVRGSAVMSAERSGSGGVRLRLADGRFLDGSHLLVAVGREPDLDGLDLEAGRVDRNGRGVCVDHQLRSVSNRRVFAVGDAAGREQFTHAAGAHAALFVRRALFAQSVDVNRLVLPRVTYTDPELAAVGLSEAEARERFGDRVRTVAAPFSANDRAIAEGDGRGFGKLILDEKGRVLGAAIVGRGAGDLIHHWTYALAHRHKLIATSGYVTPYPTRGELNRKLASEWFSPILFAPRTRLLVSILKRFG